MTVRFMQLLLFLGYIDSITVRYYMTQNLRPIELGILVLGTDASGYGIAVPPNIDKFELSSFCDTSCLGQVYK
jgi:hypothetical protein